MAEQARQLAASMEFCYGQRLTGSSHLHGLGENPRSLYFEAVPEVTRKHIRSVALSRVIDWLQHPEKHWKKGAAEMRKIIDPQPERSSEATHR